MNQIVGAQSQERPAFSCAQPFDSTPAQGEMGRHFSGGWGMRSRRVLSVAALLYVSVASGGESRAGVIGPSDFGPSAQTFDNLVETNGANGPLVLDGVTYSTSLPDMYRITSSDCLSGLCFGNATSSASFTIRLSNPVERIGGYLLGSTFLPSVDLFDSNNVPVGTLTLSCCTPFFGFQSDSNDIKYIHINPHGGTILLTKSSHQPSPNPPHGP
jgi:hypothetical protein